MFCNVIGLVYHSMYTDSVDLISISQNEQSIIKVTLMQRLSSGGATVCSRFDVLYKNSDFLLVGGRSDSVPFLFQTVPVGAQHFNLLTKTQIVNVRYLRVYFYIKYKFTLYFVYYICTVSTV